MDISIFLVVAIIVLGAIIFYLIFKNNNQNDHEIITLKIAEKVSEGLGRYQQDLNKNLNEFSNGLRESQRGDFENLRKVVDTKLDRISSKVQENLEDNLKKGQQTFTSVIERLAKIDEAQKKIEGLSSSVVGLQEVLSDKKSRGIFGEVQLGHILKSIFGDNNQKVFLLQATLSNGKIVDALLDLPEPLGKVPVDSKFPLENYKRMVDSTLTDHERTLASREFKSNVKKHIDDIADKYLTPAETSEQAIMFLPAEAIFAEIHAYHPDLIDYAQARKVWPCSPTTFMATLSTIQTILMNIERNKYMTVMHEEINKLGLEFERYQTRWNDLAKHLQTVNKDVEKIHITSDKISTRFRKIQDVELGGPRSQIEQ